MECIGKFLDSFKISMMIIVYSIYTHSSIENMKYGTNTYDRPSRHAGALNSKQTQSQNCNTPPAFKSAEHASQVEPPHMYG